MVIVICRRGSRKRTLSPGGFLSFLIFVLDLLLDEIGNGLGVRRADLIEKNGHVEIIFPGHRFGADDDPFASEFLGDCFAAPLQRQQQVNLDLGHRFEILVDLAISPGATQIARLGDNIRLIARKLDGDVVVQTRMFSSFCERCGQRLRLLRLGLGPGSRGLAFSLKTVLVAIIFSVAVIAFRLLHRFPASGAVFLFPGRGF